MRNVFNFLFFSLIFFLFSLGIISSSQSSVHKNRFRTTKIVSHAPLIDNSQESFSVYPVLETLSCKMNGSKFICPKQGFDQLQCTILHAPNPIFSGLAPQLPVAECIYMHDRGKKIPDRPDGIYLSGCMFPFSMRYAIFEHEQWKLYKDPEALRKRFAPIQTQEEALSFAVLMTGLTPKYDLKEMAKPPFFLKEIHDTHVEETPEGYLVNLYSISPECGCDDKFYFEHLLLVKSDGTIINLKSQRVFLHSKDLCID